MVHLRYVYDIYFLWENFLTLKFIISFKKYVQPKKNKMIEHGRTKSLSAPRKVKFDVFLYSG